MLFLFPKSWPTLWPTSLPNCTHSLHSTCCLVTSSLSNVSPSGVFHWTFLMGCVSDNSQLNLSFFFHFSCILLYHHYPVGNWLFTCIFSSIENHFLPIICIWTYIFQTKQYISFANKKEQKCFNKVSTGGATVTTSLAPRLQLFAKTLLGVIELVPMKQPSSLSDSIGKDIFLTLTHILQVLQVIQLHPMI